MAKIKNVFIDFRQALAAIYDPQEIEAITLLILSEVTGWSKAKIKAFPDLEIDIEHSQIIAATLIKLKKGEPVQYILAHTEFYGLPFKVNPSVLIPRPETEELVEWAINSVGRWQLLAGSEQLAAGGEQLADGSKQFAKGDNSPGSTPDSFQVQHSHFNVLDIGTGSGCVAISLKKKLPNAVVSAIDISTAALETAKQNAILNDVKVNFAKADILNLNTDYPIAIGSPLTTDHSPLTTHYSPLTIRYSLIISNPPYVTLEDKSKMHANVTDFEPHTALFVPKDDPLLFYRAIAGFAKSHLTPNGLLFLEINESLGNETMALLKRSGFTDIELKKDMSGRDRMIKAVSIQVSPSGEI